MSGEAATRKNPTGGVEPSHLQPFELCRLSLLKTEERRVFERLLKGNSKGDPQTTPLRKVHEIPPDPPELRTRA